MKNILFHIITLIIMLNSFQLGLIIANLIVQRDITNTIFAIVFYPMFLASLVWLIWKFESIIEE